jgi:hypothetical protein
MKEERGLIPSPNATSRIFAAMRHRCDIIYTFCLPNAQYAPTVTTLMIISTLRVGPWGPLFFFWDDA